MKTCGQRIRQERKQMGMSMRDLAANAGISVGYLCDVENDKRNIGSEKLLQIVKVLRSSMDYLMTGHISRHTSSGKDLEEVERRLYAEYYVYNTEQLKEYEIDISMCEFVPRYAHIWKQNKNNDGETEAYFELKECGTETAKYVVQ